MGFLLASPGGNMAMGLLMAALVVAILVCLPALVGTAMTVARRTPEGRWNPLAMGTIISFVITLVAIELVDLNFALLVGGVGLAAGWVLGAAIGGIIRLARRGD